MSRRLSMGAMGISVVVLSLSLLVQAMSLLPTGAQAHVADQVGVGTLRGQVVFQKPSPLRWETGLSIGGATVAVQGTNLFAVTDGSGGFTISGVPAGIYHTMAVSNVSLCRDSGEGAIRGNVLVPANGTADVGQIYVNCLN